MRAIAQCTRRFFSKSQTCLLKPFTITRFSSTREGQWSTPLAKTIADAITTTGPISIAAYMRQCLTAAHGGYYAKAPDDRDQFGRKGDFITSPEISQVFGELVGIWVMAEWMAQGKRRSGVELIELGPGRGTLMDDVLRTIRNFKPLADAIESVSLVESDPGLRGRQQKLLCGDAPLEKIGNGHRSHSKYTGTPVIWFEDLKLLPQSSGKAPFIIAHEFFDALPIHAFQSVGSSTVGTSQIQGLSGPIKLNQAQSSRKPQWRELLVTNNRPSSPSVPSLVPSLNSTEQRPDFQLVHAKASNPASLVIPESSQRYRALLPHLDSVIEISPESQTIVSALAERIGSSSPAPAGAALIIDYGPSATIPTSTLRGIRSHELVSPFSLPGRTDLSADVDFTALAEAALKGSERVEVHGPVEQGAWLGAMGARERVEVLMRKAREVGDEEKAERVRKGVDRLMERGGGGMGKLYKAMAVVPENGGRRRPVGFGR